MKKINDGGPAFPTGPLNRADVEPGMTLQDWFAGMALAGSNWGRRELRCGFNRALANECYAKAEAMMAERKRKP